MRSLIIAVVLAMATGVAGYEFLLRGRASQTHDDPGSLLRAGGSFPISLIPGRWTEACLYEITDWSERGLQWKFPEFLLFDSYVVALILRGSEGQEAQLALWNALRDDSEPNCIPVRPQSRVVRRDQWEVYLILGLE